jgi:hypothetical protein
MWQDLVIPDELQPVLDAAMTAADNGDYSQLETFALDFAKPTPINGVTFRRLADDVTFYRAPDGKWYRRGEQPKWEEVQP